MSSTIDEFMSSALSKFKEFVNTVTEHPFNCDVSYMYDTNKNKYIDVVDIPGRYIVKEYSIDIVRICETSNTRNNNSHMEDFNDFKNKFENKFHINNIFENALFKRSILNNSYIVKQSQTKLIFILDNYCNIYVPNLKLYILNNYSKYDLYSFYVLYDGVFDLNEYFVIFTGNEYRQQVQTMCAFKSEQLKSDYFKKLFADAYLPVFLKEIKYNDMVNSLTSHIELSNKFNLLNSQKHSKISDDKITTDEITDDKHLEIKLDETFNLVNELINKNKSKDLEYIENKKREIENIEEIRKLKNDILELKSKISEKTITNNNLTNKVKQQEKTYISEKLNEINRLNEINDEKRNLLFKIIIKYKNNIENLNNYINKCIKNN